MPQNRSSSRATIARLLLFALLGWALYALKRDGGEATTERERPALPVEIPAADKVVRTVATRARTRSRGRRLATSLAFATLFFSGAALSAGAGDAIVDAMNSDTQAAATATCDEATEPADGQAADESCPNESEGEPSEGEGQDGGEGTATEPETGEGETGDTPTTPEDGSGDDTGTDDPGAGNGEKDDDAGSGNGGSGNGGKGDSKGKGDGDGAGQPPAIIEPHDHEDETSELDPEASSPGSFSTVWLHRAMPDPTPPARRLAPSFARRLQTTARRHGVDWELVLAAFRANGRRDRVPATPAELRRMARTLSASVARGEWEAFLALRGYTPFADRAMAFTRYYRAVGLRPLVTGLEAAKKPLAKRVLADKRVAIYPGGRADVAAGRIDVRVLVLMRYMAEAFGSASISSLQTGHRLYSRPGVISAHVYGLAVDIAALNGSPIAGNSQPGGMTEQAVRDILLLPVELRPKQVISLLGLGGPSFPMANHYDHIHVGY